MSRCKRSAEDMVNSEDGDSPDNRFTFNTGSNNFSDENINSFTIIYQPYAPSQSRAKKLLSAVLQEIYPEGVDAIYGDDDSIIFKQPDIINPYHYFRQKYENNSENKHQLNEASRHITNYFDENYQIDGSSSHMIHPFRPLLAITKKRYTDRFWECYPSTPVACISFELDACHKVYVRLVLREMSIHGMFRVYSLQKFGTDLWDYAPKMVIPDTPTTRNLYISPSINFCLYVKTPVLEYLKTDRNTWILTRFGMDDATYYKLITGIFLRSIDRVNFGALPYALVFRSQTYCSVVEDLPLVTRDDLNRVKSRLRKCSSKNAVLVVLRGGVKYD